MQASLKSKAGFGLISVLLTLAVIGVMVFGAIYATQEGKKNQIEIGQDAIKDAENTAKSQNEWNTNLQNEINTQPQIHYDSIRSNVNRQNND